MPLHLILGGRYMGKRAYAESLYGQINPNGLFDFACDVGAFEKFVKLEPETTRMHTIWLMELQEGVRTLMQHEREANLQNLQDFFLERVRQMLEVMPERVVIAVGTEVGCGVVPMDPFERRWRDETGRLYQALAAEADFVDRVWAGLALRLKP